jgi:hypothetical protein
MTGIIRAARLAKRLCLFFQQFRLALITGTTAANAASAFIVQSARISEK